MSRSQQSKLRRHSQEGSPIACIEHTNKSNDHLWPEVMEEMTILTARIGGVQDFSYKDHEIARQSYGLAALVNSDRKGFAYAPTDRP
jgi:hypothetical protein